MNEALQEIKSKEDIEVLSQAFQTFTQATEQLQSAYDNLQDQVNHLDLELAKKNAQLEENLREKEEVKNYLFNIMESLTNGVIVVDEENKITTFNRTAGIITGLDIESCLGKKISEVFAFDLFQTLTEKLRHCNERQLSVDRDIPRNGNGHIPVRVSASPVLDQKKRPIGTVLVVQDMTRLKSLEDEAQRNQRLRAMGEMAAGIAHEIRNPLGGIELFASLLNKDLKEDKEKQDLVEHIRAGVKNTDRIISSLLLFAKSPRPSRQKCAIHSLLNELLDSSPEIMVPGKIQIKQNLCGEDLKVNGDRELLQRVFLNLISNAIQAMPEGGVLGLHTSDEQSDNNGNGMERRKFTTITISDTGSGIAAEDIDKIFNPFFTTKNKGTGLGLAISHNIIKAHQGTIDVESGNGKTVFTVQLPAWDEEYDAQ
jgi:PAS domain S-box-containing protein